MKIQSLYVYPIKSLRGVELPEATLTTLGLPHDRIFMLLKVHEKTGEDGSGARIEYENMHISGFNAAALFCPRLNTAGGGSSSSPGTMTVAYHPPPAGGATEEETAAAAAAAAAATDSNEIEIPLEPDTSTLEEITVTMHQSATRAYAMEQKYSDWFTARFGFRVVLAYLGGHRRTIRMSYPEEVRPRGSSSGGGGGAAAAATSTEPASTTTSSAAAPQSATSWLGSLAAAAKSYALGGSTATNANGDQGEAAQITFADCAPYLIASARSLDDLHPRLENGERMDMTKFRPNIVISGAAAPWEEDYWGELLITGSSSSDGDGEEAPALVRIACVHNCGRCKSVNVDYATGAPGATSAGTMLKRMQRDRRVDPGMKYSPIFGRYSFLRPESAGRTIRVGDEVAVSRVNAERTVFGEFGLGSLFFLCPFRGRPCHFCSHAVLMLVWCCVLTLRALDRLAGSQHAVRSGHLRSIVQALRPDEMHRADLACRVSAFVSPTIFRPLSTKSTPQGANIDLLIRNHTGSSSRRRLCVDATRKLALVRIDQATRDAADTVVLVDMATV